MLFDIYIEKEYNTILLNILRKWRYEQVQCN